jgi:tRNA1Val (adenine37-N6)-methyltransferase
MFHFQKFDLEHDKSTLKIGTDAVLLAALTQSAPAKTVLDIGCGCGVIAFCLAQQLSENQILPQIFGIDVDVDSILEAQGNAHRFPLLPESCLHFDCISLQEFVNQQNSLKFDLIVSNPPYFHNDLKPLQNSRMKSKHGDGQLSFQELMDGVDALLSPQGRFALILPTKEDIEFQELIKDKLFCRKVIFIRPTSAKPVFRVIREYVRTQQPVLEEHLSIRNAELQYTPEYLEIVKPYLTLTAKC